MLLTALALFAVWVLQTSKTIDLIPYTEKAGGFVPVHKTRYEWHPERVAPFLKTLPRKASHSLRKGLERFRKGAVVPEEKAKATAQVGFRRIQLKNGSEIYGRILEEKEGLVWIEIEGGKIAFKREEIASSAP